MLLKMLLKMLLNEDKIGSRKKKMYIWRIQDFNTCNSNEQVKQFKRAREAEQEQVKEQVNEQMRSYYFSAFWFCKLQRLELRAQTILSDFQREMCAQIYA